MPPKAGEPRGVADREAGGCSNSLSAHLFKPLVLKDAAASKVVYARVKGFPHWPAQVLSKAAAKQHLGNVTHTSKSDVPVIFFGTSEIAWVGAKDVASWEDGMRNSYHNKGRKNKKFIVALEQVRDFLSLTTERLAPSGWWCAPPPRNAAPLPDEPPSSDEEMDPMQQDAEEAMQLQELQRNLSNRYAAAAVAAAAEAEAVQKQHAAAAAGALCHTAAADAAASGYGCRRSACDDGDYGTGGSSRRGQLWRGSSDNRSRFGNDHGSGRQPPCRRRTSNNIGHGAREMWGDGEHQQQHDAAAEQCNGYRGARGHANAFMQRRKRQLLQQEVVADGSESDMTDTESLAMAAMAIAELAQSNWDQPRLQRLMPQQYQEHSQHMQPPAQPRGFMHKEQQHHFQNVAAASEAALAADAIELDISAVPQPADDLYQQQQQPDHGKVVTVKLKVTGDAVGLGVQVKRDAHALRLPPCGGSKLQQRTHYVQQSKDRCGEAAANSTCLLPVHSGHHRQHEQWQPIKAKYEHGGEGLPCSCSWKYTVSMPSAAPAVAAPEAHQLEVPAVSVCAEDSVFYKHLFAGFAMSEHHAEHHDAELELEHAHAELHGYGMGDQHYAVPMPVAVPAAAVDVAIPAAAASGAPAPVVEGMAAMPTGLALGPRKARSGPGANLITSQIAAANAAIFAAFAASGPSVPPAAAVAVGCSLSAQSGGSGSSKGIPYQRKRSGNSGSSMAAAAAAAAAAAHVLTPAYPGLDAAVGRLLLELEPVIPNPSNGDPDPGFQLPRKMLMNRPPKFEYLKRNLFVSKERPKRRPKDDVSVCDCRVEKVLMPDGSEQWIGCKEGCLNRLSCIHCDPRTCPCGVHCTNKPFHYLKGPQLDVFLTENRGHGVRVTAPVKAGQFVIEYAGEVIDQVELQRRMDAARDSGEQHFYIMEMGPGLFIDARKKGNHARLLNSCCDPNCETQKWRDAATGEIRIGIFTRRDISENEELTYDYMFEHYGVGGMAQGFKCQCGAPNCRGTMDINPERKRDWGRRVEVFWEGDSVYYRGTITGYSTSSGKHTILYDDGDTERVRLDLVPHRWLDGDASPHSSAQVPSGSPGAFAGRVVRTSPLPLQQSAAAPADSGSWSQTEQEAAAEDGRCMVAGSMSPISGPAAAPRGSRPNSGRLGLSPLGPGGAAAKAALDDHLGFTRPAVGADVGLGSGLINGLASPGGRVGLKRTIAAAAAAAAAEEAGEYDDEAAADALVVLGMAAEAELADHVQQPQGDEGLFQRPQVKRRRLGVGGYLDQQEQSALPGQQPQHIMRGVGVWPHSSSTSSQSACGQLGLGCGMDGASPLSPAGQLHAMPGGKGNIRPSDMVLAATAEVQGTNGHALFGPDQAANDVMDTDGSGSCADGFLPLEQLLSGIQAIKSQGPAIFRGGGDTAATAVAGQQQRQHQPAAAALEVLQPMKHGRLGQLLGLVGQITPVLQQKQQQDVYGGCVQPGGVIGRASSWAGSTTSSNTLGMCQLPLFCESGQQQRPQPPQQQSRPLAGGVQPSASTSSSRTQLQQRHQQQAMPGQHFQQQLVPYQYQEHQQHVPSEPGAHLQVRPAAPRPQQQVHAAGARMRVVLAAANGSSTSMGSWCSQQQLGLGGNQQPAHVALARPSVPQQTPQAALGVQVNSSFSAAAIAAMHRQQAAAAASRGPGTVNCSFSASSASTAVGTSVDQQHSTPSPGAAVLVAASNGAAAQQQQQQQTQLAVAGGATAGTSPAPPASSAAAVVPVCLTVPVALRGSKTTVQGSSVAQQCSVLRAQSAVSGTAQQCTVLLGSVGSGGSPTSAGSSPAGAAAAGTSAGAAVAAAAANVAAIGAVGSIVQHMPQAVDLVAQ